MSASLALPDLSSIVVRHGSHEPPESLYDLAQVEACAMEHAYLRWAIREGLTVQQILAGWTDHPDCTCPSLAAIVIRFNDRCGEGPGADERRSRVLGPILDLILGTKSSPVVERRRVWMATDWGLRVATPKLLRLTKSCAQWADRLAELPEITDERSLQAARNVAWVARDDAWRIRSAAWNNLRATADATATVDAATAATATVAATTATVDAAGRHRFVPSPPLPPPSPPPPLPLVAADASVAAATTAVDAAADATAVDAATVAYRRIYACGSHHDRRAS